jgi:hypothetical protein
LVRHGTLVTRGGAPSSRASLASPLVVELPCLCISFLSQLRRWEPFSWRLLDRGFQTVQRPDHARMSQPCRCCCLVVMVVALYRCASALCGWLGGASSPCLPCAGLRGGAGGLHPAVAGPEALPNGARRPGGFCTSGSPFLSSGPELSSSGGGTWDFCASGGMTSRRGLLGLQRHDFRRWELHLPQGARREKYVPGTRNRARGYPCGCLKQPSGKPYTCIVSHYGRH